MEVLPNNVVKEVPQLVQFKTSQMSMLVGIITIVFLGINFVVNYVEKRTDIIPSNNSDVIQILNQQTTILGRLEVQVNTANTMLQQRTPQLSEIQTKVTTNGQVLASMVTLLNEQARVLREQTIVLQKLSTWLDMQIQEKK